MFKQQIQWTDTHFSSTSKETDTRMLLPQTLQADASSVPRGWAAKVKIS